MLVTVIKTSFLCVAFLLHARAYTMPRPMYEGMYHSQCYALIRSFLNQYQRQLTVLDINAQEGYYSLNIAQDYDAVCVMIEGSDTLLEVCTSHDHFTNIVLLNTHPTCDMLQHLGECEHFDVILALHGLPECGKQRIDIFKSMLGLGDYVIIAVSSSDKELEEYIVAQGGQSIGTVFDGSNEYVTLYSIALSNKHLKRKTWLRSLISQDSVYRIESSFTSKQLIKPLSWPRGALTTTPWIAGINLCTFKMCQGTYPTPLQLQGSLRTLKNVSHTDWLMNNMIVRGTTLALIDGDDSLCKCYCSDILLQAHQEMLALTNPAQVEHYFWNKLTKVSVTRRQIVKFLSHLFPACSLVFDIDSFDPVCIDSYLGYGAKVVCCNPTSECIDLLCTTAMREHLGIVSGKSSENIQDTSIDYLIARYGKPHFCIVHRSTNVLSWLKTMSQPIDCIAFRFDVCSKMDLVACLEYVMLLGYTRFNFSVRTIPAFILENNPYIHKQKKWVNSCELLLNEIDEYAQLDYDGKNLWGYIYAHHGRDAT